MTDLDTLDRLQRDVATALCLDGDEASFCGICWIAAADVLPVVERYAKHAAAEAVLRYRYPGITADEVRRLLAIPEAGPYCTCSSTDGLHALACRINR